MSDESHRQHAPSARRRQEARQQGHVALSREFVLALMYAACGVTLLMLGPVWLSGWTERLQRDVRSAAQPLADPLDHLRSQLLQVGWCLLPWLLGLPVVVVLAHWIQHGPLWLPQRLSWDPARVDPLRGVQRILRARSLAELLLAVVKISVFAALAVWLLEEHWVRILQLTAIADESWARAAARLLCDVAAWLGVGLLVWGGIDFAWRLFQHERELRMSPEEPREDVRAVHNHVSDPRPANRSRR
jgi:flagellar biosynthetic protein FlhB